MFDALGSNSSAISISGTVGGERDARGGRTISGRRDFLGAEPPVDFFAVCFVSPSVVDSGIQVISKGWDQEQW